jgi:hypothetical protein
LVEKSKALSDYVVREPELDSETNRSVTSSLPPATPSNQTHQSIKAESAGIAYENGGQIEIASNENPGMFDDNAENGESPLIQVSNPSQKSL